ncbi:hypothetical protein UFOVP584_37 [uncultured Caudovirales phage]|uniref:Uncharacterized protein n=1 Tax=uncultured Caudovirales phage TaxID=2100421 RepID=A0A6J5LP80_9CAUD|nr:hypothetical protein UFOVP304_10 [uncultured Caudovirales phage]CAB4151860.1 hypothetical protein UFOVP584_37 [uncultured Caudovirales phage]
MKIKLENISETFVKELCKEPNIKEAFVREGIIEEENKNKTAVEWLCEKYHLNKDAEIIKQAKEMEKEQMHKCASFWRRKENAIEKPIFEQYYNEKFKK